MRGCTRVNAKPPMEPAEYMLHWRAPTPAGRYVPAFDRSFSLEQMRTKSRDIRGDVVMRIGDEQCKFQLLAQLDYIMRVHGSSDH